MTSPTLALPVDLSPADVVALLRTRSRTLVGRLAARLTARLLAFSVMLVIATGTALAIVTTRKSDWYTLHFSELGTFDDFSGHTFNTTLIVAGLLITAFAVRVRIDLHTLTPHRRVRPSRTLTVLMVSVGVNLLGVGLVPLNTIAFLHDRLASGIMLSFLGLLVLVVIRRRHVNPLLLWATVAIAGGLVTAIVAFIAGVINLAALEFVGFTLIFVWVGVFTASLEKGIAHVRSAQAPAVTVTLPDTRLSLALAPAWGCTRTTTVSDARMPRTGAAPVGSTVSTTCDAASLFPSPTARPSSTWPRSTAMDDLVRPRRILADPARAPRTPVLL